MAFSARSCVRTASMLVDGEPKRSSYGVSLSPMTVAPRWTLQQREARRAVVRIVIVGVGFIEHDLGRYLSRGSASHARFFRLGRRSARSRSA